MDNSIGKIFKITSFGESHGDVVGIIIDGVPAGLEFDLEFIQNEVDKRKPGQSNITTTRVEEDQVKVMSGVFKKRTTGAPLCLIIENKEIDSSVYNKFKNFLRPSHIDYSALRKYGGFSDYRGSGRFSGRITSGFVMAGAIAKQILNKYEIKIFAYTQSIGDIIDDRVYSFDEIEKLIKLREKSQIRALNHEKSVLMVQLIEQVIKQKDSIGGTIKC
ncbi:MAG: chorismate synthase, partial [Candidatus Thorarchaeota archaeon]